MLFHCFGTIYPFNALSGTKFSKLCNMNQPLFYTAYSNGMQRRQCVAGVWVLTELCCKAVIPLQPQSGDPSTIPGVDRVVLLCCDPSPAPVWQCPQCPHLQPVPGLQSGWAGTRSNVEIQTGIGGLLDSFSLHQHSTTILCDDYSRHNNCFPLSQHCECSGFPAQSLVMDNFPNIRSK